MPRPLIRPPAAELVRVLNEAGSITEAAEALGVARSTVHDWLDELGIERGEWRIAEEVEPAPA